MKKLYTLLVLIFIVSIANAQSTNGLVAHWNFDGNANDISSNGHNGTEHNISYTTGKKGRTNTAAKFSGNSFISIPHDSEFNLQKYSICTIVLIDSFNTYYCQNSAIIRKGREHSVGAWGLQLLDNMYDSSCAITGDTTRFNFAADAGRNNNSIPHAHWQYTPNTRTKRWYCIVATFDSSLISIYIDGQLIKTAFANNGPVAVGSNTDSIVIGANTWDNMSLYPYWLYGVIDDIKIYNRVLSSSEISNYCNAGIAITNNSIDTNMCIGNSFNLSYTTSRSYVSGNIFTAQLSDATGSFASPVNIGSVVSQSSGIIACTIPTNTTAGNGYRIRVTASNPAEISDNNGIDISLQTTGVLAATISASPSNNVNINTPVTFTTSVSFGGTTPTYQWRKNGVDIAGATNANYTGVAFVDFIDNDTISVFVKGNHPCPEVDSTISNAIIMKVSDITQSINKIDFSSNIHLYPNPNSGTFSIKGVINTNTATHLTILNSVGQVVYQQTIMPQNKVINQTINTNNQLASGIYMLQLKTENGIATKLIRIN